MHMQDYFPRHIIKLYVYIHVYMYIINFLFSLEVADEIPPVCRDSNQCLSSPTPAKSPYRLFAASSSKPCYPGNQSLGSSPRVQIIVHRLSVTSLEHHLPGFTCLIIIHAVYILSIECITHKMIFTCFIQVLNKLLKSYFM